MNRRVYFYVAAALAIAVVAGAAAKASVVTSAVSVGGTTLSTIRNQCPFGPPDDCLDTGHLSAQPGQPSATVQSSCDLPEIGSASGSLTGSVSRVVTVPVHTLIGTVSANGSAVGDNSDDVCPFGEAESNTYGVINMSFQIADEPANVSISIAHNGARVLRVSLQDRDTAQMIGELCPTCDPPLNSLPTVGVLQPGRYDLRGFIRGISIQGVTSDPVGDPEYPPFDFSLGLTVLLGGVTETAYHWISPAGGTYVEPSNWDPTGTPMHDSSRSDTAIFDLHTGSPIPISAGLATTGRWEILDSSIDFFGNATLSAASSLPPSLAIGFGGRLNYQSGFLTTQNSVIGNGPPQSQLILGTGTTWFNLGTLRVGTNGGAGGIDLGENAFLSIHGATEVGSGSDAELTVHDGAVAQFQGGLSIGSIFGGGGIVTVSGTGPSRRSRLAVTGYTGIGNPLAPSGSPGFLTVTGGAEMELNGTLGVSQMVAGAGSAAVSIEGSLPTATATVHGTILLGELGPGDMIIQGGGTVDCTTLNLGSLISGANGELQLVGLGSGILVDQNVQVGGSGGHGLINLGTGTFLNATGNVTVGHVGGGELILNSQSVATIGNGLSIGSFAGGAGAVVVSGAQAELDVTGLITIGVGSAVSTGSLTVRNEAKVVVNGNFHVDHFKSAPDEAAVFVASLGLLDVNGDIFLGVLGPADMIITSAGAECTDLTVGGGVGGASGLLVLEPQALMFVEDAQIGGNGGYGLVRIDSRATLDVGGTMTVGSTQGGLVTVNGQITGTGLVMANPGGIIDGTGQISASKVTNGGTIAPGLSPGMLTLDADFDQLPSGVLIIEYAGLNPGEFDVLHVTGQTTLSGRLEIHFRNGFSPDDPAAFVQSQDFVEADGGITGDYDQRIYAFPDIFADFDNDSDKDLRDVAAFQNCFGLSGAELGPACDRADWESNGVLNDADVRELASRQTDPS